jgi:hypothetical protein
MIDTRVMCPSLEGQFLGVIRGARFAAVPTPHKCGCDDGETYMGTDCPLCGGFGSVAKYAEPDGDGFEMEFLIVADAQLKQNENPTEFGWVKESKLTFLEGNQPCST